MDSRNSRDFSDSYCLLYGHHMDNGAMFGDVAEFVDEEYFDTHRTGTLYLLDGNVIAPLLDCIQVTAVQYRDIGMMAENQVIGLSTCAEAQTNGRIVIFGRMERKE